MSNIQFDFSEKRVLITGGGQGIGRKMTEDFLSSGAEVIVWEKSLENLEQLQKDFPSSKLTTREVDVSSKKHCELSADSLTKPIDFLINNAGILRDRSLAKMTWEEYSSVMQTNLGRCFFSHKVFAPSFQTRVPPKKNCESFQYSGSLWKFWPKQLCGGQSRCHRLYKSLG